MRTLLATPCVHFYDDHLAVDLMHAKGSGQKADVELCSIAGKVLDTEKHSDTQPTSIFTGARFVWTMSSPWGVWLLQPSQTGCKCAYHVRNRRAADAIQEGQ